MLLRVEHNLLFGRDVIQVPLKVPNRDNEYVNLVLSHREFDVMAVHIPQYDVMQPSDLVEEITRLVKEQAEKHKAKRHTLSVSNQSGDLDTTAIFQARILELEYEVSRLNTKLAASRALQSTLTEENAVLRSNLGDLERRYGDMGDWRKEREELRADAAASQAESARLSALLRHSHARIREMAGHIEALREQVSSNQTEIVSATQSSMERVLDLALRRERVLQQSYFEEKKERQLMAEKFFEISGRIRVFCRLRPLSKASNLEGVGALVRPKPNALLVSRNSKEFSFDQVFGSEESQETVYAQIEPVVVSFADGFNACILAYGQTGAGKTYTMVGGTSAETRGMIPRALQQVFSIVRSREITYQDTLCVSMVEIYNDQILDLLADGSGVKIKNESDISKRTVTLWEHVTAVLDEGNANRNIASTSMNVESSRSHAMVFLHLESQHRETREVRRSTLCLVDLAGSERISRSQVEGDRLRETQHINKSLSALGDVMYALQHKSKHVPYRNSKLTFMLRDMLSGNAKTLMMLQLSPDDGDVEETLCSLQFGARVSQIQMGAVRASVESGELIKLKDRNQALELELAKWRDAAQGREEELEEARTRNKQLERALDQQQDTRLSDQLKGMKLTEEDSTLSDDSASSVSAGSSASSGASGTRRPGAPVSPALSARSGDSAHSAPPMLPSSTASSSLYYTTTKAPTPRRNPTASPRVVRTIRGGGGVVARPAAPLTRAASELTPDERASRRRSLTASTSTVARERLARTTIDPENRRATLSGSLGGGVAASPQKSPSTRIRRTQETTIRRATSLATSTTSSVDSNANVVEKRRAASSKSLPSTPLAKPRATRTAASPSKTTKTSTTLTSGWR
ncbi:hypothetical protein PINS_up002299 [Pythium insidiosum]|nr:hypothetical protein PINS_up002299 [Pythium insidiosum]